MQLTDWGGCLQVVGVVLILAGLAFWPAALIGVVLLGFGFVVGIMERNQLERRRQQQEDRARIERLEAELRRRDHDRP